MSPMHTLRGLPGLLHSLLTRLRTRKSLFLVTTVSCVIFLFYVSAAYEWTMNRLPESFASKFRFAGPKPSECSPQEYNSGQWIRRPYWSRPGPLSKTDLDDPRFRNGTTMHLEGSKDVKMTKADDILDFARFGGCASSREFWWHLAADRKEQWDRFPGALEWEWVPGGKCGKDVGGLREWVVHEVVRDLVERGGWLLVGDSVTENHFFSLSCLLYPHVIATPDYTKHQGGFDRAWPQHLYLNPESPLFQDDGTIRMTKHKAGFQNTSRRPVRFPIGFDPASTPLVTFRRIDILWEKEELVAMHKELHPEIYAANPEFQLFGDEAVWTMSPDEYLDIFTKPMPEANYAAMIVSTAGHWTTGLFHGYHKEEGDGSTVLFTNETELVRNRNGTSVTRLPSTQDVVLGYDGLLTFFGEAMERWAEKVQSRLERSEFGAIVSPRAAYPPGRGVMAQRQVLVRAYLPGHEDCHSHREAWNETQPFKWNWWNWGEIWKYNRIFENVASNYTNIHFLNIDRPGRTRPDAHASGDCLHIMTGAGVLEGWSHYIWHYLTREV